MNYSSTPSRHIIPRWELIALQLMLVLVLLGALLRLEFAVVTGTIRKLSSVELLHAMIVGLRFDAAIAAIITLLTVFVLWLCFRSGLLKSRSRG